MQTRSLDELTLAALAFLGFLFLNILRDQIATNSLFGTTAAAAAAALPTEVQTLSQAAPPVSETPAALPSYDPNAIAYPYETFTLTQGPHGKDYGHLAIDLTAGKGATIRSPISGVVTAHYIDEYGNTVLVIENERYRVTLMHGLYSVEVGQFVELGQPIGKESNQGYTIGTDGRVCYGRDCGYHTHLNIYDKRRRKNVNPLTVLPTP